MDIQIKELLQEYSPGDELEIRLGYFKDGDKFHSVITSFMFFCTLKQFSESGYKISKEEQLIYMGINNDPMERFKTIVTTDEMITIHKRVKKVEDFVGLGLRVALSTETIMEETIDLTQTTHKDRTRTTFYNDEINYKIDLTMDQQNKYTHYQLEVEFISKPSASELKEMILWLHKYRELLYHNQKVIFSFNRNFVRDPKYKNSDKDMPYNGGAMPKNLKPYTVPFLNDYVVSSKPNGISYFLYFSEKYGVYYINRTEIHPVSNKPSHPLLYESIVIGEYISLKSDSEGINNKFYAFDFLIFKKKDVRGLSATERHDMLVKVKELVNWNNFDILPQFFENRLEKSLKVVFNYIASEWTPETNDGIVLKPQNMPFNNPYVYKWKPWEDITIDLAVKIMDGVYYGMGYDRNNLTTFVGSKKFPYSGEVDLNGFKVPEFSILEFRYKDGMLRAIRVRSDKIKPNYIGVAISTWEDIHEPFSKENLLKLSKLTINHDDSLIDVTRKICGFIKTTKDPRVFDELSDYIDTDVVTKMFKGAALLGNRKKMGNELVPVLSKYFK